MFDDTIQPQLPSQHAEDQFVAKRAIFGAHFFTESGQKHRRVSGVVLDTAQNFKGCAARGRNRGSLILMNGSLPGLERMHDRLWFYIKGGLYNLSQAALRLSVP